MKNCWRIGKGRARARANAHAPYSTSGRRSAVTPAAKSSLDATSRTRATAHICAERNAVAALVAAGAARIAGLGV